MAARRSSKSAASTGNRPQNTTDWTSLEALQRLGGRLALVGDGVADGGVGHFLDLGGDEADLAGAELSTGVFLGRKTPTRSIRWVEPFCIILTRWPAFSTPSNTRTSTHHAQVGVVPGVDQQAFSGAFGRPWAAGRRVTMASSTSSMPMPDLARAQHRVRGVDADDVLDLLAHPLGLGGRQVDLVQDRDDLVVVVDGLVDVGQGLGLDPLRRRRPPAASPRRRPGCATTS